MVRNDVSGQVASNTVEAMVGKLRALVCVAFGIGGILTGCGDSGVSPPDPRIDDVSSWLRSDGGVSDLFTEGEVKCAAKHIVNALEDDSEDVVEILDSGEAELQISLAAMDCFESRKLVESWLVEREVDVQKIECFLGQFDEDQMKKLWVFGLTGLGLEQEEATQIENEFERIAVSCGIY